MVREVGKIYALLLRGLLAIAMASECFSGNLKQEMGFAKSVVATGLIKLPKLQE
jgi:hypothetical protein